MRLTFSRSSLRLYRAPALVALLSLPALLCAIDPGGSYPNAPQGPGLTLDEPFNVSHGVYLIEAVRGYGLGLLAPESIRDVFGSPRYLADHPPLGRFWIGLCHQLCRAIVPPVDNHGYFFPACGRTASVFAFALLVFLVGGFTSKWYGEAAGLIAAVSVVLMPRLFAHAHLASLETFIGLTYSAAALSVAHFWRGSAPPNWRVAAWTGCVFGMALLSKIQGVLLLVPVALWSLSHWRLRAFFPLMIWACLGLLVFFCFWPWLWLDPLAHMTEYFARTTNRVELHTWYLGRRYSSGDVPWHYPAVMFLTTVPLGLHALGLLGLLADKKSAFTGEREQLVLGCLVFPLLLFSLPGIGVYDGARLFLVVFPLWAVFVGRGGAAMLCWLTANFSRRKAVVATTLFLSAQAFGILALTPCWLSYYNLAVGGLPGAARLGLATTYWGDSVTRELLEATVDELPNGATIVVVPVLDPSLIAAMSSELPIVRRHNLKLRALDQVTPQQLRYVLVYYRQCDIPPMLWEPLRQATVLAEVRRQGVLLAALYQLSPPVE